MGDWGSAWPTSPGARVARAEYGLAQACWIASTPSQPLTRCCATESLMTGLAEDVCFDGLDGGDSRERTGSGRSFLRRVQAQRESTPGTGQGDPVVFLALSLVLALGNKLGELRSDQAVEELDTPLVP